MSKYKNFLQSHRVYVKGQPYTHGSMVDPKGVFYIQDFESEKHWTLYSNVVINNKNNISDYVGVSEKPEKYGPLRIDFDFKYNLEEGKARKYTKKDIENVIDAYQNIIINIIDPTEYNERMTYCVVLEKSKPRTDSGFIKDGFHLHFPYFVCNEYIQDVYIRNKIIQVVENDKKFEEYRKNIVKKIVDTKSEKLTIQQQVEKMIDKVYAKNWLLYGSVKDVGGEIWKATNFYNDRLDEVSIDKFFADDLKKIYENKKVKNSARYYLPKLLSIACSTLQKVETPLKETIYTEHEQFNLRRNQRKKQNIKQTRATEEILEDLKIIEEGKIMSMLKDFRADDYNEWINVGWTLFNIGQGCEKAQDMWVEFSKRSDKYQEGVCEKEWDKMELGGRTIASLLFLAKNDSPDEYKAWNNLQLTTLLIRALYTEKPTHYSIAKIMHKLYEYKFVCADSKHDIWYEYYNHRWHPVDNGVSILRLLPEKIHDIFLDFVNKLTIKGQEDEFAKEKTNLQKKRCFKIMTELCQAPFCKQVLVMCKGLFHNQDFMKKLDENRDLLGFENGVYDLKRGMFRDGSPDDYITFSTGNKYNSNLSFHSLEVIECMDYLHKVFVNPNLRNYFQDFVCSCLKGGNVNKIFAIFSGEGGGGKSVIVRLLEKVFGDYCMSFPRETFIMGRAGGGAGGARPDLARVRGKRIAFVKEIAKNEKLHIGMIKEMTGNDTFFARNLFEKGTDINPMFTLVLMTNEEPEIPAHDEPTWERIRILEFQSKFPRADDPKHPIPEDIDEQFEKKVFPRDPFLMEKLGEYVDALTWILLERFKTYIKDGIKEVDEVSRATNRYKVENDVFLQFIEEKVVKVDNKKVHITLKSLFGEFKIWYQINYPSYVKEKIGEGAFRNEMSKRIGSIDMNKKCWYGYQLKEDVEESDGEDEDGNKKVGEGENSIDLE